MVPRQKQEDFLEVPDPDLEEEADLLPDEADMGSNDSGNDIGLAKLFRRIKFEVEDEQNLSSESSGTMAVGAANLTETPSIDVSVDNASEKSAKTHRAMSMSEMFNSNHDHEMTSTQESNTNLLRYILEHPGLRSLFRAFLRSNLCEENLAFWLDVQHLRETLSTTSRSIVPNARQESKNTRSQAAMEREHESLMITIVVIYNTYLAPSSPCKLKVDHGLKIELVRYIKDVVTSISGKPFHDRFEPDHAYAFNQIEPQTMTRMYERIQTHVFRIMVTDSVPEVRLYPFSPLPCFLFHPSVRRDAQLLGYAQLDRRV
jgi:GTPase-activating protein SST2